MSASTHQKQPPARIAVPFSWALVALAKARLATSARAVAMDGFDGMGGFPLTWRAELQRLR
jgi:hypothetical protein